MNQLIMDNENLTITKLNNEPFVIIETSQSDETEKLLESEKLEYGYYDEYTTCSDCNIAIRTQPDSYSWSPDFFMGDGFLVCKKCFDGNKGYKMEYVEMIINNPKQANRLLTIEELNNAGFLLHSKESYQNGLHQGMNDKPVDIFEILKNQYDVIFHIDHKNQFYICFDCYVKEKRLES